MGWFSDIVDSFTPEWVKEVNDQLTPEWLKKAGYSLGMSDEAMMLPAKNETPAPAAAADTIDIGSLTAEEAQQSVAMRLARLSKYFTSPLGVLGSASTGSTKVFS